MCGAEGYCGTTELDQKNSSKSKSISWNRDGANGILRGDISSMNIGEERVNTDRLSRGKPFNHCKRPHRVHIPRTQFGIAFAQLLQIHSGNRSPAYLNNFHVLNLRIWLILPVTLITSMETGHKCRYTSEVLIVI